MVEEKKIIVDEDWKEEAQHEKEKLAKQEKAERDQKKAEEKTEPVKLPPGDFAALISTLATQALYAMGMLEVEEGQKKAPNLEMARYNIDMLATLQEKTKGNLTEQETAVLESTLSQVRMAFVKVAG